jgi:deazaflavin-dependent oxidoreductase (nitroreductase family)
MASDALARAAVAVPTAPSAGVPRLLGELTLRVPGLTRRLTRMHATVYLWTGGRLVGRWFGLAILVLETVGRRSGVPRRVPVAYLPDGENLVVVPANGGAHRPPAWWLNLLAAGEATAVLGRERLRVRAYEATGAERERLWQRFAFASPVNRYQRRTSRRIPVVVLTRVAPCPGARAELRLRTAPTPRRDNPRQIRTSLSGSRGV